MMGNCCAGRAGIRPCRSSCCRAVIFASARTAMPGVWRKSARFVSVLGMGASESFCADSALLFTVRREKGGEILLIFP